MATDSITDEIQAVLDGWAEALFAKDLEALARFYTDDVRVFDLAESCSSYAVLRSLWEKCFPFFTQPIGVNRRKVQAMVGTDIAVITCYTQVTGTEVEHPAVNAWMRTTVCLRKVDDGWKIFHDHISFPADCENEKPVYLGESDLTA